MNKIVYSCIFQQVIVDISNTLRNLWKFSSFDVPENIEMYICISIYCCEYMGDL